MLIHQFDRKAFSIGIAKKHALNHLSPILRFRPTRARKPRGPASEFVRRHKRRIVDALTAWTGETRPRVERVLAGLAHLCDQHHLVVQEEETATLIRFTTFASTLIVNRVHTLNYRLEK